MDNADRDATKVRAIAKLALSKVDWRAHGFRVVNSGKMFNLQGRHAFVQIDLTASYSVNQNTLPPLKRKRK